MAGIITMKVDSKKFLAMLEAEQRKRTRDVASGLRKIGRMYVRTIQRQYMSGRPGLKRVTGHLARTWYHTVVNPRDIDNMVMVVWTPTEYGKYHADVYEPRGGGRRRMPVRLRVGKTWNQFTKPGGKADEILEEAYGGR